jgi:hypothetical protein
LADLLRWDVGHRLMLGWTYALSFHRNDNNFITNCSIKAIGMIKNPIDCPIAHLTPSLSITMTNGLIICAIASVQRIIWAGSSIPGQLFRGMMNSRQPATCGTVLEEVPMPNHVPQPSRQSPEWEIALLTFIILISVFLGVGYVISLNLAVPIPWLAILVVAAALTGALYTARQRRRPPIE